jgi:hypothetical protein
VYKIGLEFFFTQFFTSAPFIYIYLYIYISFAKSLRIRQLFLAGRGVLEFKRKVLKSVTFHPVEETSFNIFFQIFMHFLSWNIYHTLLLRVITVHSCRRAVLVLDLHYAHRWIGRGRGCVQDWPARSPDLTRMCFHLSKHTENMYKVKTDTRVELLEPYCMLQGAWTIQEFCAYSTFHLEMCQTASPGWGRPFWIFVNTLQYCKLLWSKWNNVFHVCLFYFPPVLSQSHIRLPQLCNVCKSDPCWYGIFDPVRGH